MVVSMCFDKNYQKFSAVCLKSLLMNYEGSRRIRLVIVSDVRRKELNSTFLKILNEFDYTIDPPGQFYDQLPVGLYFPKAAYWRLQLPSVLAKYQIRKAIYLDSDLLVLDDLLQLFNHDLDSYFCGGCLDISSKKHTIRLGLKQTFTINGGLLLMDVIKMNQINWIEMANQLAFEKKIKWYDQDVLNIVLDNKIKLLDLKWNVQTGNIQNNYSGATSILHFTESNHTKPWVYGSKHPQIEIYNWYMKVTGFYLDFLKYEGERRIKKMFRKITSN
jgi:lipopolysaccharide biosynthesis glycosyltransferase